MLQHQIKNGSKQTLGNLIQLLLLLLCVRVFNTPHRQRTHRTKEQRQMIRVLLLLLYRSMKWRELNANTEISRTFLKPKKKWRELCSSTTDWLVGRCVELSVRGKRFFSGFCSHGIAPLVAPPSLLRSMFWTISVGPDSPPRFHVFHQSTRFGGCGSMTVCQPPSGSHVTNTTKKLAFQWARTYFS